MLHYIYSNFYPGPALDFDSLANKNIQLYWNAYYLLKKKNIIHESRTFSTAYIYVYIYVYNIYIYLYLFAYIWMCIELNFASSGLIVTEWVSDWHSEYWRCLRI